MEADRWIDRVASQKTHLPEIAELKSVEEELRSLVAALQEVQAAETPLREAYEDAKAEAERLSTRAADLEKAMSSSTVAARDLAAMQTELEHIRSVLGEVEDRELNYLLELEPLTEEIANIRSTAQPLAQRRTSLQESIVELQASLEEELVALRASRHERASAVAPALLARYDQALVRAGGSGAANVDAGRCDGCRIALSPLDLDRWKAQPEDSFMACPECGRLLLP